MSTTTVYENYRLGSIKRSHSVQIIKSATGTGKTFQYLKYLHDIEADSLTYLLLSSKRSFAKSVHARLLGDGLNIECYLNKKENTGKTPGYIVQAESLHTLQKCYDVIILDEATSFLAQMDSPFHKNLKLNREMFDNLLISAKHIVCLDADIDERIVNHIQRVLPERPIDYIVNTYKSSAGLQVTYCESYQMFLQLRIDLQAGKRIQIVFGALYEGLMYEYILKCLGISYIFHSAISDDYNDVLVDVNKHWSKYQVVMYTGTIGPGIDFCDEYFHVRYTFANRSTNNVREIFQMRARVRKLIDNREYVSFSGNGKGGPTTIEEIKRIMYDSLKLNNEYTIALMKKHKLHNGFKFNTDKSIIWDIDMSSVWTELFLLNRLENNRSSKNYIPEFLDKLEATGATFIDVHEPFFEDAMEEILQKKAVETYFKEVSRNVKKVTEETWNATAFTDDIEGLHKKLMTEGGTAGDKIQHKKTALGNKLIDRNSLEYKETLIYKNHYTQVRNSLLERDTTILGGLFLHDIPQSNKTKMSSTAYRSIMLEIFGKEFTTRDRTKPIRQEMLRGSLDHFIDVHHRHCTMLKNNRLNSIPHDFASTITFINHVLGHYTGTKIQKDPKANKNSTTAPYYVVEAIDGIDNFVAKQHLHVSDKTLKMADKQIDIQQEVLSVHLDERIQALRASEFEKQEGALQGKSYLNNRTVSSLNQSKISKADSLIFSIESKITEVVPFKLPEPDAGPDAKPVQQQPRLVVV